MLAALTVDILTFTTVWLEHEYHTAAQYLEFEQKQLQITAKTKYC